ncbi:MAG: hypothetical protein NZ533_12005, partial [Casimicrobiaceae bacterium]|nr:hypothetical protein [Casimicrobiaceae bacterium]
QQLGGGSLMEGAKQAELGKTPRLRLVGGQDVPSPEPPPAPRQLVERVSAAATIAKTDVGVDRRMIEAAAAELSPGEQVRIVHRYDPRQPLEKRYRLSIERHAAGLEAKASAGGKLLLWREAFLGLAWGEFEPLAQAPTAGSNDGTFGLAAGQDAPTHAQGREKEASHVAWP